MSTHLIILLQYFHIVSNNLFTYLSTSIYLPTCLSACLPICLPVCLPVCLFVLQNLTVDVVVGLEARGFLIGPLLAQKLNAAFVPIRKIGKLPGITSRQAYSLEYGQVEIDDNISNKTVVIRLFFALKKFNFICLHYKIDSVVQYIYILLVVQQNS